MDNKINYYLAVFIDVLGQGQKLKSIKGLPKDNNEAELFNQLFKETIGAVQSLHTTFESFFKSYNEISPEIQTSIDNWDEPTKKKFLQSRNNNLKYLNFSDTVVLYFSLDRKSNKAPMRSVYTALASVASSFLINLSSKIPLRGAINVGIGTELEKSGIYGPILQNLHYLESEIAKSPRIIIGDELVKMIEVFENEETRQEDMFQLMDKATIPSIKKLITIDEDGKTILNYLDLSISQSLGNKNNEVFTKLKDFVGEQKSLNAENKTIVSRYEVLENYIQKNQSNWV